MQYGIKSVSFDDIARKSGLSKKDLYSRFANKGDLVNELVIKNLELLEQEFDAITALSVHPLEKIARIYEILLRQQLQYHPSMYRIMVRTFPESIKPIDAFQRKLSFTRIPDLLDEAKNKKHIKQEINSEITSELCAWFMQKMVHGEFYELLQKNFKSTFEMLILYPLQGLLVAEHAHLLNNYSLKQN